MDVKNIGTEKALQKIRQYCAYQERNHREVKEKLYSFGLYRDEVEQLLAQLIEENYLNEERFAIAFAGGKFRMKGWGRIKIRHQLKQQQVSDYCIRMALAAIDEDTYLGQLQKLLDEKNEALRNEKNSFIRRKKVQAYLMQKGYEPDLIYELLKDS